jgi:antitoxin FitA
MATLTVRNLEEEIVRRLRIRAAEHRRSAEAEHREILRAALVGEEKSERLKAAQRLADFRRRTDGRNSKSSAELLAESRSERTKGLTGFDRAT